MALNHRLSEEDELVGRLESLLTNPPPLNISIESDDSATHFHKPVLGNVSNYGKYYRDSFGQFHEFPQPQKPFTSDIPSSRQSQLTDALSSNVNYDPNVRFSINTQAFGKVPRRVSFAKSLLIDGDKDTVDPSTSKKMENSYNRSALREDTFRNENDNSNLVENKVNLWLDEVVGSPPKQDSFQVQRDQLVESGNNFINESNQNLSFSLKQQLTSSNTNLKRSNKRNYTKRPTNNNNLQAKPTFLLRKAQNSTISISNKLNKPLPYEPILNVDIESNDTNNYINDPNWDQESVDIPQTNKLKPKFTSVNKDVVKTRGRTWKLNYLAKRKQISGIIIPPRTTSLLPKERSDDTHRYPTQIDRTKQTTIKFENLHSTTSSAINLNFNNNQDDKSKIGGSKPFDINISAKVDLPKRTSGTNNMISLSEENISFEREHLILQSISADNLEKPKLELPHFRSLIFRRRNRRVSGRRIKLALGKNL